MRQLVILNSGESSGERWNSPNERTARRGMLPLGYSNIGCSKTNLAFLFLLNAVVFLPGVHIWVPESVLSLKKR